MQLTLLELSKQSYYQRHSCDDSGGITDLVGPPELARVGVPSAASFPVNFQHFFQPLRRLVCLVVERVDDQNFWDRREFCQSEVPPTFHKWS